jgi:hypothetical protein
MDRAQLQGKVCVTSPKMVHSKGECTQRAARALDRVVFLSHNVLYKLRGADEDL